MPVARLAQVQARQVEAEDLGLPSQGPEAPGGEALAAVRAQAGLQQPQVGDELHGLVVGARRRHVVGPPRPPARLERRPELAVHVAQLLAVGLAPVALLDPLDLVRERELVLLDAAQERLVHAHALGGAEVPVQALDAAPQQAQRQLVMRAQRLLGRGDRDVRVAVAVAADPARRSAGSGSGTRVPG